MSNLPVRNTISEIFAGNVHTIELLAFFNLAFDLVSFTEIGKLLRYKTAVTFESTHPDLAP